MSVIREGIQKNDDGSILVYGVASGSAVPSDAVHVDGKLVPFGGLVRPDGSLVVRWV